MATDPATPPTRPSKPRLAPALGRALRTWRRTVVDAEVERAPGDARLLIRHEAEALEAALRAVAPRGAPLPANEPAPSAPLARLGHALALRAGLLEAVAREAAGPDRAAALLAAGAAVDARLTWLARAAAEEAAALGETLLSLRDMFENLRDGLIFVDRNGVVQDLNRSAIERMGIPREHIVGHRFHEIWPSPPDRPFEPVYRRVLETGATETLYDVEFAEPPLVFDLVVAPRRVGGEVAGTVSIVHYRTEQKALERELHHVEKMSTVGQLATGIAHELKNLLAGVRGYAEIARDEAAPGAARSIEKLLAVTERATRLTEGLLSFARRGRPRKEAVDLARLADDVLELGVSKKDRRAIQVVRRAERDLPPVLCDANQVEQVLLNLVLNAIEAMRGKPGTLTVALARCEPGFVEVAVSDTGPGIPRELHRKIFEPFFTTKETFGPGRAAGTGLGLSISRSIVEQHGGTIELESAPGAGATFHVRLPAAAAPAGLARAPGEGEPLPGAPGTIAPPPPPAIAPGRRTGRILVADDEDAIRDIVKQVLRKAGYEVATARTVGRARKMLSAARYDLLFLDLIIPGMRGPGTLRRLKRRHPDLRIVVLTGQALGEEALAKVAALTDDLIEKPFAVASILDVTERMLTA